MIARWSDLLVYLIADMNAIDSNRLKECLARLNLGKAISEELVGQSRPIEVPGANVFIEGRMNADRVVDMAHRLVQEFDGGNGVLSVEVY